MFKRKSAIITLALITVVFLSLFIVTENSLFTLKPVSSKNSPFLVGIEIGWRANVTECKALIDKVKNYTNLLIISAGTITCNEVWLNQTCDYAYNAGMYIMVYWEDMTYSPQEATNTEGHSYHPFIWIMHAKEKYGDHFLGSYFLDELGGKQLDSGSPQAIYIGTPQLSDSSYKDCENDFLQRTQVAGDYSYLSHSLGQSMFTSDYGLYWFDYKLGYDTVLAQLGWNNSRTLQIAQVRGAATVQNKDWGVIITWTYQQPPYLETGSQLYQDLVLSYESGAKYAAVYDASQSWINTTLTDEHFSALENFWNYTKQNPQKQGSLKADTALVLPEAYGFGFRSPNDSIWGIKQADNWTQKMYSDVYNLLGQYGSRLDIVYSDPEFNNATKISYKNVQYWTAGTEGSSYSVVDLNSTMGYSTIQDAINSLATNPGDTLYVKSGTYHENVVVNKTISLIGENKTTTIIDGGSNSTTLCLTSGQVNVNGFTLQNGGNFTTEAGGALILDNANNCNITGNIMKTSNIGVYLKDSANNTLKDNIIQENKFNFGVNSSTPQGYINDVDTTNTINGKPICYWINEHNQTIPPNSGYVALVNCTKITVQNMQLSHNYNGLLLAHTQNSTVANNTLAGNREGVEIDASSGIILRSNVMKNNTYNLWVSNGFDNDINNSNTVDSKQVIYWTNQHNKTVPINAGYVALVNCTDITVQGLSLSNNGQGILLFNTTNSTVTQNIVTNAGNGIELIAASNNTITQNTIVTNENSGITAAYSDDNSFLKNTLTGNGGSGFSLYASSTNKITSNNMTANGFGIRLRNSPSVNTMFNIITENWVAANKNYVDREYDVQNNTFYHNNFIDNVNQLPDNGTGPTIIWGGGFSSGNIPKNFWDNGKEGNYWSDYTGTDENHDGIGDSSYYIRNLDQDNYPLMQPYPIP